MESVSPPKVPEKKISSMISITSALPTNADIVNSSFNY